MKPKSVVRLAAPNSTSNRILSSSTPEGASHHLDLLLERSARGLDEHRRFRVVEARGRCPSRGTSARSRTRSCRATRAPRCNRCACTSRSPAGPPCSRARGRCRSRTATTGPERRRPRCERARRRRSHARQHVHRRDEVDARLEDPDHVVEVGPERHVAHTVGFQREQRGDVVGGADRRSDRCPPARRRPGQPSSAEYA